MMQQRAVGDLGPNGWEFAMIVVQVFYSLSFPLLRCIVLYLTLGHFPVQAQRGCVHTYRYMVVQSERWSAPCPTHPCSR
jgi:hypothetical protein